MSRVLKRALVMALTASALWLVGMAGPAMAAPGDEGNGVGGCVDNLYGNATNPRPSGNGVLPSQSPGPFLNIPPAPNEPPRNDRTRGPSVGDVQTAVHDIVGPPAGNYNGRDVAELMCTFP